MLAGHAGLAAALAASVGAMLLPPSLNIEGLASQLGSLALSSNAAAVDPFDQVVKLECPGCPFAMGRRYHSMVWSKEAVDNSLVLNFTVAAGSRGLELNNVMMYPPIFQLWPRPLFAAQVPSSADLSKVSAQGCGARKLMLTEYEWEFTESVGVSNEGATVVSAVFKIDALEGHKVAVPPVTLKLIKGNAGELMIASIETGGATTLAGSQQSMPLSLPLPVIPVRLIEAKPQHGSHRPHGHGHAHKCHGPALLCQLRRIFGAGLRGVKGFLLKGCGKKLPVADVPGVKEGKVQASRERHHHRLHQHPAVRLLDGAFRGAVFIFFPLIIGVAVGFLVFYMIGLAVGVMMSAAWSALRRWKTGGRGTYGQVDDVIYDDDVVAADDADADDRKAGFAPEEYVDAPPEYQNAVEKEAVQQ